MKILFLSHRLPFPPDHGSRIRAFHVLRHLAREHEVTVAALVHPGDDPRGAAELSAVVPRVIAEPISRLGRGLRAIGFALRGLPASFGFFASPRLAARLASLLARESFDLIFVFSSSMGRYVDHVELPKILDFCDMDSLKWRAFAAHHSFPAAQLFAREGRQLEREEARLARLFDASTVASAAELAALRKHCGPVECDWFGNGVDHHVFCPGTAAADPDSVCFLGRMDYFPNIEAVLRFCAQSWPLVRRRRPTAQLTIIGANPPRSIRRLDGHAGVRVTGTVDDVRPFARRAGIGIAPLAIARGTQNKILESMAMGLAVVATGVAAQGIDAIAGEHLLVAEGPEELAAAIVRLLEDDGERQRLAAAGRARVRSHHDWDNCLQRLDALLERCRAQAAASGARVAAPAGAPRR